MRFILAGSNTENLVIRIAGHNMTLVSLDGGYDVEPLSVRISEGLVLQLPLVHLQPVVGFRRIFFNLTYATP